MPDEPITPTREVRVPKPTSDTQPVPQIVVGPETANRSKAYLSEKTVLAERWEVTEFLGEGGMSAVYKMKHLAMGRYAAAKILHPHLSFDDKHLQRFQREAQAASAITHPNVISIYDCGVTPDGRPFILMEYLPGKSLSDELKEKGRLPLERALTIFLSICDGMAHAHEKGVVHRDLKPSNVMLVPSQDGHEVAKVVDFGIARMIPNEGADGEAMHQLTQTGEVFGSPLYMSPEQCLGKHPDQRSDVYAMGCLMYEVLAGEPPLKGESFLETMHKQLEETPKPFVKSGIGNSKEKVIEGVILKCLAKDPVDRYGNMQELRRDMALAAGDTSIFSFLKTKAGRELFKRFGSEKKKEIKFVRMVTIVGVTLLPLSIAVVWIGYLLQQFDEIPTGINSVHNEYWPQRQYLQKVVPSEETKSTLEKVEAGVSIWRKQYSVSGIAVAEDYSRALKECAERDLAEGMYAIAQKNLEALITLRREVYTDADPAIWLAKLARAKCLYFQGLSQSAKRAFGDALALPTEAPLIKHKREYLEAFDMYGELLLKQPIPNYDEIAQLYERGADWAISKDSLTSNTEPDIGYYLMFSNLRADAMRVQGNPNDVHERALVARQNAVHADDDVKVEGEHKKDKVLKQLKQLSPLLWKTRQLYRDILKVMNNEQEKNTLTDFQQLMYFWGRGGLNQKFGILKAKSELEEANRIVAGMKFDKSKEVEAQILKDLALIDEKADPVGSLTYKLKAVDVWRSRK